MAAPISRCRPPSTHSGWAPGQPLQDVGRGHALSGDARAPGARAGRFHELGTRHASSPGMSQSPGAGESASGTARGVTQSPSITGSKAGASRRRIARRKVPPREDQSQREPCRRKVAPVQSSRTATAREHRQDHPTVDLALQKVSRAGTGHCQEPAFPPCSYARTVGVHGGLLTRRRELPGRNTNCRRRSWNR